MQPISHRTHPRLLQRIAIAFGCLALLAGTSVHAQEASAPAATQSAENPERVVISPEVMTGLLIKKTNPVYPREARENGLQGQVILHVIIGTDGLPKEIHVVSGHSMLQPSAIAGVQKWQWRPYLLNGKAVEVDTTIKVNFFFNP